MKITVLQPGARHNYMHPRFLFREGLLQRLHTDFALEEGWPAHMLSTFAPSAALRGKFARRTVAEIPQALIRIHPSKARQVMHGRPPAWPIGAEDLSATDLFFTQYFAGGHGLRERIRADAKIVSDVFIVPSVQRIVRAECDRFGQWGERALDADAIAQYDTFTRTMLDHSDALFCPAQAVIDDVASYGADYASKCVLVPYGSSLSFPAVVKPEPRRVLFAGTMTLRKGPQYVKQAADLLEAQGERYSFVFAGGVNDAARAQLEGANTEVLGHISKERMASEYARADVFVLPSLAEGSAGVVLEAMAAGLPVVVTRAAGVDFTDGEAGIYVGQRDAEAIASAILAICGDRTRRAEMSQCARERAAQYGEAEWQQCFVSAIRRVAGAG